MKVKSMLPTLWGENTGAREPFRMLQNEIDRLFADFSAGLPALGSWGGSGDLAVRLDVADTGKALEVTAELPGVDEKDIEVTLADDILTIKAEKKSAKDEKTKDYHMVERTYGTYARSMRLPFKADAAKTEAKFDKGVLTLTVAKPAEAQAKLRKIEVKAAA